jgi:hypothetical protein
VGQSLSASGLSTRWAKWNVSSWSALGGAGNLYERVVSVSTSEGKSYTGAHGDGEVDSATGRANEANWPAATSGAGAGFRGGSYDTGASACRISDRSRAASFDNLRLADYGGRGVRSAP